MGTPHYMAPEQAAGHRREVGPATDVYALGATLYEVLTGRPPFRGETDAETLRLVLDAEPVAPRSLRPGLPRDLETICLKCLRKEPARRYASAAALRDDLRAVPRRPADPRPAGLGRGSAPGLGPPPAGRRRPAGLVVLLAGGLVGGVALVGELGCEWHNRQLEIEIARADRQAREAEKQTRIAEERRRQADRHHYAESLRRARRALDARQIELAQDILHDIQPGPDGDDPAASPGTISGGRPTATSRSSGGTRRRSWVSAVSRDGKTLATWDLQGKVLVWDLAPDMELDKPRAISSLADAETEIRSGSRPTADYIATLDQGTLERGHRSLRIGLGPARVGRLDLWDRSSGSAVLLRFRQPAPGCRPDRPDGGRSVDVWDLAGGTADPHSWPIESDHHFLRGCSADGQFRRRRLEAVAPASRSLDRRTAGRVRGVEPESVGAFGLSSFSADGRFFAAHTPGNRIVLWDTAQGRELTRFEVPARCRQDRAQPERIATGRAGRLGTRDDPRSSERTVTGPDLGLGTTRKVPLSVVLVRRNPPGDRVSDGPRRDHSRPRSGISPRPGGSHVFPGRKARGRRRVPPGRPVADPRGRHEAADLAARSAGRARRTGRPHRRGLGRRLLARRQGPGHRQRRHQRAPDDQALGPGFRADCWRAGRATRPPSRRWHSARTDACSPRGAWIPASRGIPTSSSGTRHPIERLASLEGHTGPVRSVAFSPDGRWLATASDDLTARLWDVAEQDDAGRPGRPYQEPDLGRLQPRTGRLLATASNDATVRLWDVATGQARTTLRDVGNVLAVAFAPDGSLLASANEDGASSSGTRPRASWSGPSAARRISSAAWRSRPTGATSSRRAKGRSSGSGTSPPARSCSPWRDTRPRSTPWRFRPTDRSLPRAIIKGRSSSGGPIGPRVFEMLEAINFGDGDHGSGIARHRHE